MVAPAVSSGNRARSIRPCRCSITKIASAQPRCPPVTRMRACGDTPAERTQYTRLFASSRSAVKLRIRLRLHTKRMFRGRSTTRFPYVAPVAALVGWGDGTPPEEYRKSAPRRAGGRIPHGRLPPHASCLRVRRFVPFILIETEMDLPPHEAIKSPLKTRRTHDWRELLQVVAETAQRLAKTVSVVAFERLVSCGGCGRWTAPGSAQTGSCPWA